MQAGNSNRCRHCGKVLCSREKSFINGIKVPVCAVCAGSFHIRCEHCGKFFDERYIYQLNGMKLCFSCREHDFFKCRRCAGFFPRSEVERDGIYFLCRRCFEYERYIASDDDIEAEVDVCDDKTVYADEIDDSGHGDIDPAAENVFDIGAISHVVNEIATFALLHKLSENEEQPRRRHRRTDSYREHCDCDHDCDRECDCDF